jgi:ABC-type Na+ efflux pump permease subunit
MSNFKCFFVNDLKKLVEYRILHLMIVLTLLFSATMAFVPSINPSNIIYVSIFIVPVILFSISMYIEKEENTLLPLLYSPCKTITIVFSKIASALVMSAIPIFAYSLVLGLVLKIDINYFYFVLAYFLGVALHIIIGLSLSIISKSSKILSTNYIVYIVVFSVIPIFYNNGLIPLNFQYFLVISPAFLSGLLIDNILVGVAFSSAWWIFLTIILQIIYIIVLTAFVIVPYFKSYLLSIDIQDLEKRGKK